jgi:hypothetical protein
MTDDFIDAWIAEADARRHEIKSRTRWLVWGLTSGVLPADHPTLPPRITAGRPHATRGSSSADARESGETFGPGAGDPEALAPLWQTVRARLTPQVRDAAFRAWLAGVELYAIVPAPSHSRSAVAYLAGAQWRPTTLDWADIQAAYGQAIEQALSEVYGYSVRVAYADTPDDLPAGVERGVWAAHGGAAGGTSDSGQQLWSMALADLQRRLPQDEFETWLRETRLIALEDDQAIVGTSNIFVREKVQHTYVSLIDEALTRLIGRRIGAHAVIDAASQVS